MNELEERKSAFSLAVACWMVRIALLVAFLSAVADRLGIWGPPRASGVSWGNIPNYEEYVAQLNWYLPTGLVPAAGLVATTCGVIFAIGLLIGWRLRWVAVGTGLLLTIFAVTMAAALGPKSTLGYSVSSAAAVAFLLAAVSLPARSRKMDFDLPR